MDCEVPPVPNHGLRLGIVYQSSSDNKTYMKAGDAIYYGCGDGFVLGNGGTLVKYLCNDTQGSFSHPYDCKPVVSNSQTCLAAGKRYLPCISESNCYQLPLHCPWKTQISKPQRNKIVCSLCSIARACNQKTPYMYVP